MTMEAGSIQYSIGSVLSSSFGVYARNFVSFTVVGLIIGLINLAFEFLLGPSAPTTPEEIDWYSIGLGAIVAMLAGALMQAAVIHGTFQDMRGNKASIGECISRGLVTVVPVVVATIIYLIALTIGITLLLVPGIIVMVLWWLYVPAIVVERKGILGGFGRSAELTKGRRWQMLGQGLIMILLVIIVETVVGFVVFGAIVEAPGGVSAGAPLWATILSYVISAIVTVFLAIVTAVTYFYLRAEKEGVGIEELASVFD